jgi:myo-inositol-1(or 4)-monophosphatase
MTWQTAIEAALEEAAALALRGPGEVRTKADGSVVTEADLAVEALLDAALRDACPGDGLLSEEGRARPGEPWWCLDPIDGTSNFARGAPDWSIALARVEGSDPVWSALRFPARGERWTAQRGGGAWVDGRRLPALPGAGDPAVPLDVAGAGRAGWGASPVIHLPHSARRLLRLRWPAELRSPRCVTRSLAAVAAGEADAALIGPGWGAWDLLSGLLLLWEVGGGAWTLSGAPLRLGSAFAEPLVVGAPPAAAALALAIEG